MKTEREIRIRIWSKKTNTMSPIVPLEVVYMSGDTTMLATKTISMLSTNNKDINGLEICEGDYVKTKDMICEEGHNHKATVTEIIWDEDNCALCLKGEEENTIHGVEWSELEVIGNIYENELS